MSPNTVKAILLAGSSVRIRMSTPVLMKEYIGLAISCGGTITVVGTAPPEMIIEYAKLGGKHLVFDLASE